MSTLVLLIAAAGCGRDREPAGGSSAPPSSAASDPSTAQHGSMEVTAELVEIPEGAIFKRDLYDYATVLRYRVRQVHRGSVGDPQIYVAQYNPWKPRSEAADARIKGIGGNVRQFTAGQVHRLSLEVPVDDHYMGGLVNKYFGQVTNAIYWAVWTDEE